MSGIDQLLHEHISQLEHGIYRHKNNPAPTVPIYDLTPIVLLSAKFWVAGVSGPSLIADHEYLIEAHFIADTQVDWYIDGTLFTSQTDFFGENASSTDAVVFGSFSSYSDPAAIWYMWDLKVGSSRSASDYINDPLNPPPPTSSSNTFPWVGSSYISGAVSSTTLGSNTVMKLISMGSFSIVLFRALGTSYTDYWMTFSFQATAAVKTAIENSLFSLSPLMEIRDAFNSSSLSRLVITPI